MEKGTGQLCLAGLSQICLNSDSNLEPNTWKNFPKLDQQVAKLKVKTLTKNGQVRIYSGLSALEEILTKLVLAQIAETQDSQIPNFHLKNAKKTPLFTRKRGIIKGELLKS